MNSYLSEWLLSKKMKDNYWEGCGEEETLLTVGGNISQYSY
jgi:hypothetical protein